MIGCEFVIFVGAGAPGCVGGWGVGLGGGGAGGFCAQAVTGARNPIARSNEAKMGRRRITDLYQGRNV